MTGKESHRAVSWLFAALGIAAVLLAGAARAEVAQGPLRVFAENPRYFTDGTGRAVYLSGSHTWSNFQDLGPGDPPVPFDYEGYLEFLVRQHHNFFRLWTWSLPHGNWLNCSPFPWLRTGPGTASDGKPRFDLTRFNPAYFERMRTRIIAAGQRGIYVSVMLFDGFDVEFQRQVTDGYPLDAGNNINGVSAPGTSSQDLTRPQVTAIEDAYVRKVIDTVNDLDNVLFEVANEPGGGYSTRWEYHVIDLVKGYEATKPYQHPIGMTAQFAGGSDAVLYESHADWISPLQSLPSVATGGKVVINDTDHSFSYHQMEADGPEAQVSWVWENFTRGNNVAFMDPYLTPWPGRNAPSAGRPDPYWNEIREALGDVRTYGMRIDLAHMIPRPDLIAGGGFCLARTGVEYLAFAPPPARVRQRVWASIFGRSLIIDLLPAKYAYQWFDAQAHAVVSRGLIQAGGPTRFNVPSVRPAVLWLHASRQ